MIRFLLAAVIALHVAAPGLAQTDPVQGVIARQIEAFEADDFETAFGFASPLIRGIFGTPERFGMMVRQGYPMVWRPAEVQYLGQETRGGFTYQRVLIRDRQGAVHTLEYEMIETGDGWQINGVQFIRPADLTA